MSRFLYISESFPPKAGGSSVINQNLTNLFDEKDYFIVTSRIRPFQKGLQKTIKNVHYIGFDFDFLPRRLSLFGFYLSRLLSLVELYLYIKRVNPTFIIAAYPELTLLDVSEFIARKLNIPFYPYLHDTISEALQGTNFEKVGNRVQRNIFQSSSHIFVMSEGMRTLYKRKYNLNTTPILHIYPESVNKKSLGPIKFGSVFWGGAIYRINHIALCRLLSLLDKLGYKSNIASNISFKFLELNNYPISSLELRFYENRHAYLKAIALNDFLILSLNWPDETSVHQDEIGTIFPTKTPEYLNSGIPIIVHCPSDYFLAEFFTKNECGIVIDTRDNEEMGIKLERYMTDIKYLEKLVENAYKVAEMFKSEVNKNRLINIIGI
jgi:glycosyltransferase involved in cell wall biosynthesis